MEFNWQKRTTGSSKWFERSRNSRFHLAKQLGIQSSCNKNNFLFSLLSVTQDYSVFFTKGRSQETQRQKLELQNKIDFKSSFEGFLCFYGILQRLRVFRNLGIKTNLNIGKVFIQFVYLHSFTFFKSQQKVRRKNHV